MALATWGGLSFGAEASAGTAVQSRGASTSFAGAGKPFLGQRPTATAGRASFERYQNNPARYGQYAVSATALDYDNRTVTRGQRVSSIPDYLPVGVYNNQAAGSLPQALYRLLDPNANVDLPPPHKVDPRGLDNRELDKLVGALGRNKATWRRALVLHEWLLGLGHVPDDRLCTTLIRVCSQHGQALTALGLYDWMRSKYEEGGAALIPTVYTYTAAMRAALSGNLMDRALKVWEDAVASGCEPDCRMATSLIEVCARRGDTQRALDMYEQMRNAPRDSKMAPSVHAYTAAMRAAAEGGAWQRALDIWADMETAGCRPTGHAYAAVISACAAGGAWERAVQLFEEMKEWQIKPDVVSCTALITALGTDGQWAYAESIVEWMLRNGVRPNVRTYTALITAMGNAQQWERALETIRRMKQPQSWGCVEPNAYTYSALLKTMGEQGEHELAEQVFRELECEAYIQAGEPVPELTSFAPPLALPAPQQPPAQPSWGSAPAWDQVASNWPAQPPAPPKLPRPLHRNARSPLNEVVCGAMMLAYERAGKWSQALTLLDRARALGIQPNTIMYNTAISALGKSGRWQTAEALFAEIAQPDAVSYETLIAAYGISGEASKAEVLFKAMTEAGHTARDYAYCGLIAAHSMKGNWQAALRIRQRMKRCGAHVTVHVYNALIAACERASQWDKGLELQRCMKREGVLPNAVTAQLLQNVGKKGIESVEGQQVAISALSAAVAAAGTVLIRSGVF
ncbi:hypothetical protein WJX72_000168 [[Myrmecia] bisecta]|uniref:PROP1-like PPR domain-containing protein n=1 Tax=[Myrmecia] bisecta TaxID=41462 RepID=A0AAW1PKI9_9CHLO